MSKKSKPQRFWTLEEEKVLLEYYSSKGPQFCAEVLNAMGYTDRNRTSVTQHGRGMNLYYTGNRLSTFPKGHIPANKGQKMKPELYEIAKHTMFKKGLAPLNTKPIGTETVRSDGYIWVKTAEKQWKQKHVHLWSQCNGIIPKDKIVVFRNGNRMDVRIDNLEMITRQELVLRNRWTQTPSEYSLLSGNAAKSRLKKRGIGPKEIRQHPELLELAQAETILKMQNRKKNAQPKR